MIVTFTDFGTQGPYLGQMRAAVLAIAPKATVIDLMSDAPAFDIKASAYLLPAAIRDIAGPFVCLGVVDPGVGSARKPVALHADGNWYVGPDNGLFALVARRASKAIWYEILWRPETVSHSFHGRDLFAPIAAMIETGDRLSWGAPLENPETDTDEWPDDLAEVICIDGYGNCMTGIRAATVSPTASLQVDGRSLPRVQTFADMPVGAGFCYENALGLIEISVNQGDAALRFGLTLGGQVNVR